MVNETVFPNNVLDCIAKSSGPKQRLVCQKWHNLLENLYQRKIHVSRNNLNHLNDRMVEKYFSTIGLQVWRRYLLNDYQFTEPDIFLAFFSNPNLLSFRSSLLKNQGLICHEAVITKLEPYLIQNDWQEISENRHLTVEFVDKYQDLLDWRKISTNRGIQIEILGNFYHLIHWYYVPDCQLFKLSPQVLFLVTPYLTDVKQICLTRMRYPYNVTNSQMRAVQFGKYSHLVTNLLTVTSLASYFLGPKEIQSKAFIGSTFLLQLIIRHQLKIPRFLLTN